MIRQDVIRMIKKYLPVFNWGLRLDKAGIIEIKNFN